MNFGMREYFGYNSGMFFILLMTENLWVDALKTENYGYIKIGSNFAQILLECSF